MRLTMQTDGRNDRFKLAAKKKIDTYHPFWQNHHPAKWAPVINPSKLNRCVCETGLSMAKHSKISRRNNLVQP